MNVNLVQKFNLQGPLFLAPLGGGPGNPKLVAAVCNAGGLGILGAAYLTPAQIEKEILDIRDLTAKPFGVNLFVPAKPVEIAPNQLVNAIQVTAGYRNELNLQKPNLNPPFAENFEKQLEVILKAKPAVFSFVFGLLSKNVIQDLKKNNIFTIGTATTLDEALLLQDSGVDAITVQGVEAGGHRGIFDDKVEDPQKNVRTLLSECRKRIRVPLIAAGGLMSGRDMAEVVRLGAQAAQLGTAFLICDEATTSKPYRDKLLQQKPKVTALTRAFSGRIARGIENRFLLEMAKNPNAILPFPAQNVFTRDMRRASQEQGKSDFLSLWAGTGVNQIRGAMPAAELTKILFQEFKEQTKN